MRLLLCLILRIGLSSSFPTGAPDAACLNLKPQHPAANGGLANFSDNFSVYRLYRTQMDENRINVTISGTDKLEGFLLQAQFPNGSYAGCGSFTLVNQTKYACASSSSAVTQNTKLDIKLINLTWTRPTNYMGDVKFVATVINRKVRFWKLSDPISQVDFSTCGTAKSCYTPNCDSKSGDCTNGISWANSADGSYVKFEIQKKLSGEDKYIAVGLSKDTRMGDDMVVGCAVLPNSSVTVFLSWNNGYSNGRLDDQSALLAGKSYGALRDGTLTCVFYLYKKKQSVKRDASTVYYPDASYYLLLASGPGSSSGLGKHSALPSISSTPLDLTKFQIASDSQTPVNIGLVKAHGIIMVLGWLIFASCGILLPRYFKPTWNEPAKCVEKPLWFAVHVLFMILVFCLQIIAFIIIFCYARVYVDDLPWPADAHPVLGIITMILVLANPIMSLFRCDPQDSNRWIFNLFHFLVGQGAFFTANICIYLAMRIEEINMPYWCIWVLVAHTVFQIITEIILSFYTKCLERDIFSKRLDSTNDNNLAIATDPDENKGTMLKSFLWVFHFLVVTGFAIAISVGIGQIYKKSD